ncbi:alkaline-phosphatase-like protein [Aspergillus pseudotamarii]|uniref:Alkaline-phosphatase-like protein n=1 Tax=Aspergillus pseudotamarii TaxID=132259 RepID=A0A5N6T1K8_ASPPS|nr:alkaline-phosphatase-like protein [Aspergillus pseudotamarii]KAE8139894.1 alkaline-phosphatase-like protein [Aspergillus pseudotamarii]
MEQPEHRATFTLHSREYRLPQCPTVVVCIDGFDPEYLQSGLDRGLLPIFANFMKNGFRATEMSCMPSFTNPNNVSIITVALPSIHGIAGNFFLDRSTGKETMICDDSLLRGSTLPKQMSQCGVRVAAVTAKDKVRKILAHGLKGDAVCFSAERAAECTLAENGITDIEQWVGRPAPSQYSADLSLYVLDAGIKLLQEDKSDFLYLTLSDYVQHKHGPSSPEADDFMNAIDEGLAKLAAMAIVGVTGDHRMSRKSNDAGEPNVLFIEDVLNAKFGENAARVICPITDPFVRHHGALGSFVRVYLRDQTLLEPALAFCQALPETKVALSGKDAAQRYAMPLEREGDIVVISTSSTVLGSCRSDHDLSSVMDFPLRSHGGLSEQALPVIMSKAVNNLQAARPRNWNNYDVFDLVLNWAV